MAEPKAASPSPSAFNFKQAISQMVQRNASDLLLKVGRPPTVRMNGELQTLEMPPVKPEDLKLLAEQIMTPRQVKEFAEKKEADFAIACRGSVAFGPTSISNEERWPLLFGPFPMR
jgi:twitching motility protein PilT